MIDRYAIPRLFRGSQSATWERRVIRARARGHFPTEQAAMKCLYLVISVLSGTEHRRDLDLLTAVAAVATLRTYETERSSHVYRRPPSITATPTGSMRPTTVESPPSVRCIVTAGVARCEVRNTLTTQPWTAPCPSGTRGSRSDSQEDESSCDGPRHHQALWGVF